MPALALARRAMNTRFELLLHGENATALRAAGEEALDEIDRIENQLSLFRPTSEIAHLNARAANEPVRVTPELFRLLQQARRIWKETDGAFDITIAPLMRSWGFRSGEGRIPTDEEVAAAKSLVGMNLVQFDEAGSTIRFEREGVMLDLGAIGKGYAIERAAEVMRDAGVTSALLHGGTSTVCAIGHPPEAEHWAVAITQPDSRHVGGGTAANLVADQLPVVRLRDEALSVSAVWGRTLEAGGKSIGHVLDPRTGQSVSENLLAAVVARSATEADALSTALLTLGSAGQKHLGKSRPELWTLVLTAANDTPGYTILTHPPSTADTAPRGCTRESAAI